MRLKLLSYKNKHLSSSSYHEKLRDNLLGLEFKYSLTVYKNMDYIFKKYKI